MLVASLLVASFVIFGALYLAPGNPVAALSGGRSLPASSLKVLEARYHLNQPFFAQYWYWLNNALHGNLGISITLRENVTSPGMRGGAGGDVAAVRVADHLGDRDRHGRACRAPARHHGHVGAGDQRDLGRDPVVRGRDLPDRAVRGQAGLVPRAGQRNGPGEQHPAPHVARVRPGPVVAGDRGPRHQSAIREEADRARADGHEPRHSLAPAVRRHILRNAAIPITTVSGTRSPADRGGSCRGDRSA